MRLGTQTIVRRGRPGASPGNDDFGNPIPGTPGTDLPITGCSVQPGAGPELIVNRDALTTLWTVWAPAGADVTETDTVAYDGTDYDVDGQIERWQVGTRLDHKVIRLKAVSG